MRTGKARSAGAAGGGGGYPVSRRGPYFWGKVEMLVMAAACGTLLGTGLLAGAVSRARVDPAAQAGDAAAAAPSTSPPVIFRKDRGGAYRTRVVIDGVPLEMLVDTGATHSLLSEADARRVFQAMPAGEGGPLRWQEAASVRIAGRTLRYAKVGVMPSASMSVIGLDWLAGLGPILLEPRGDGAE